MNKKGQAGMVIIIAIMIFIIGMSAVNLLKPDVTSLRSVTGLNCVNSSAISDGTKMTCLMIDVTIPWVIITIFAVAGGLIFTKFIKRKTK
ncbi:hypothetical protein LCGC14_1060630 [marine sediment metagenome]|uniref:Uncharacterized protein n=1 Tax=marine sediment metagenome TaxID=412755 RepID=A0A0F9MQU2_9ZZZZ